MQDISYPPACEKSYTHITSSPTAHSSACAVPFFRTRALLLQSSSQICLWADLLSLEESHHKDSARRASGHKQQWMTASANSIEPQERKHHKPARNTMQCPFPQVHVDLTPSTRGAASRPAPHSVSMLGFVMQRPGGGT